MFNIRNFTFRVLPSYIQGSLAGVLIFISKLVVYKSGTWEFVYAPAFDLVTGIVLIVAMVIGTQGDRKLWEDNGGSYFSISNMDTHTGGFGVFSFWIDFYVLTKFYCGQF